MNISKYLALFCLLFITQNIEAKPKCTIANINWLNGEWLQQSEKSRISEKWQTVSDLTMEGTGYTQKTGSDTRQYETMRIVYMSGQLYFLAKVDHNALPVAFAATACGEKSVEFSNPKHDFPNILHYQLKENRLLVDVKNNEGKGFQLTFRPLTKDLD